MLSEKIDVSALTNIDRFQIIIEEAFSKGNLAVLDDIIAPNAIEHQPGLQPGPEGLKGAIRFLRSVFPDFTLTVEDFTVDGDKVWARLRARGTHLGELMGRPATGLPIDIDVIDVCRFEHGMLVEHWGVPDRFTQLQQLGFFGQGQSEN
jgi:predicted ester cyclase